MKRQTKTSLKMAALLLASVAFAFGQSSSMAAPGYGYQYPNSPYQNSPYGYGANRPSRQAPVGPGTINYVEGQASLNGQILTPGSVGTASLQPGQTLSTGNGYVEVLLTPGAFLRVGNNSEVQIASAGLADTKVQVNRGASMIEVDQLVKGAHLTVAMNGATTVLVKKGLYNFDVTQQAVRVLSGEAEVNATAGNRKLNGHDEVLLASNHPLKRRSFDESQVKAEPLYVWSATRSESEAQASDMAASNAGEYAMAGPGWYWDPAWNFYGFWPLEASLYSPFGWGFYSPGYFGYYGYGLGLGLGYPAHWYGHPGYRAGIGAGAFRGSAAIRTGGFRSGAGFSGFHGGGFGGGGFHGGGGRR